MTPLLVRATLDGPVSLSRNGLALDALLASQVALRSGLPPPRTFADCQPIDIPIAKEPGGRFHLCSFATPSADARRLVYLSRRAPIEQYQTMGDTKIRRVNISSGANKSYRIPMEIMHAARDELTWWCFGDTAAVTDLLATVLYLGKRRAVGHGRVTSWSVEACEPWGGFPVVRDGKPLRPLPPDWPGLISPKLQYRTLDYPYWANGREVLCAVP